MLGAPRAVRTDVVGGDAFGHGERPAVSWWLPDGATRQSAYRVVTDDGYDSGWTASDRQSFVEVPVFDRARRTCRARVTVRTDLGESAWSDPVLLESGLLGEDDWSAAWIGVHEPVRPPPGRRPAYWLRSEVDVGTVTDTYLHVTALGLYEVFLNGERVGDVELAPGYTQYARRVQRQWYDVTGHLRPGPNVVQVLLADGWYRGQVGAPRAADQFGTEVALRLQLDARADDGWTTLAATGPHWVTASSHVLAADLIGGQREDRRLLDASGWAPAVARDVDVAVVRSVAPPVRRVEDLRPVAVTRLPDGASLVDLGQNINGWLRVRDLGPSGTTLVLRHGEHLGPDGDLTTGHLGVDLPMLPEPLPLGQVDVVTSAGVPGDVFEPRFTTHGFRYARIDGHPGVLGPDDVTGVVVHTDLRRTGWFACSDERVERLHDAVVWSLRGNVCDIPTDCPQRERAGWTGDWQVFAPTAAALFDVLGFSRKWLRDVALDQRDDGCVANMSPCPPAEGFDGPLAFLNGSAGWGDVVVAAPWDLYQAYGDLSLLRESWPAATRWLEFAIRGAAQGRHAGRTGRAAPNEEFLWDTGFHWGEWLEPGVEVGDFRAFVGADKSEVATAYLHRSAATLVRIGELLGEDVARYRRVADGAREAWRAEFVADDGTLLVQTQASHVRALAFDLVPPESRDAVAARLVELVAEAGGHLSTGFLSTGLLLPTMAEAGHVDAAYALLLQDTEPSWLTMLDRGATTVWEHWGGVDAEGEAHGSLNHYSKGAVASFLHRHVAGLQPTAPGYRTFRVAPLPGGGLTWAAFRHVSPFGSIEVAWRIGDDGFVLDVQVPPGTSAEIVLPDGTRTQVGPGEHRATAPWPHR
ncbi:family 78 glycoside hydrolase catalytic domain [Cellulomonas sp. McL0617]|uniref:family 78 glycoside hydrolase catalytic domain n=1 Tax=Cellulomonas sp. McL0617 TaxID=3415675 RepID=UPI003CF67726